MRQHSINPAADTMSPWAARYAAGRPALRDSPANHTVTLNSVWLMRTVREFFSHVPLSDMYRQP